MCSLIEGNGRTALIAGRRAQRHAESPCVGSLPSRGVFPGLPLPEPIRERRRRPMVSRGRFAIHGDIKHRARPSCRRNVLPPPTFVKICRETKTHTGGRGVQNGRRLLLAVRVRAPAVGKLTQCRGDVHERRAEMRVIRVCLRAPSPSLKSPRCAISG